MHIRNNTSLLILFVALMVAGAWGQETQVTASVESDTVGLQDQFQLSIAVSGKDSGDAENPRFPRLQGFRIVSGPSLSTQFQWINGRSSSSKSFVYILIPEKEGQYTIDPVEVPIAGKVYKTQPLQIRVTPGSRAAPPQSRRSLNPLDPFEEEYTPSRRSIGDALLVKADLDKTAAYAGQQVTLTYRIFTQVGINGIQLQDNPPLSGFWVEDIEVEKTPRTTRQRLNGREYQVFVIKKQALFATTTGKLKIPSNTFAIAASPGGDMFSVFSRSETLYRKTEEITLDVKPLPDAGKPPGFQNAVGSFNLSAHLDKTQAATGDAVVLQVKLEGTGNLKTIPDISVPPFPDFTIYSSKRVDSFHALANDQMGGEKTWEFIIVPRVPGPQTIPAISFSFFNVEKNKYETIATPPLNLTVTRGADSTASGTVLSGIDKQNLVRRGTDIHFIKTASGAWERETAPLYRSLWFYLLASIPLLCNIGLLIYQKRHSRYAGDARFVRNKRARRLAMQRLKSAQKKGYPDARPFYDAAAAALSGYLSDKFGLTEIELTGDHLEKALSGKSVPHEIVAETRACLQECDFGRFVSASASQNKTRELSKRIHRVIDAMEGDKTRLTAFIPLVLLALLFSATGLRAFEDPADPAKLFAQGNTEYQGGNYASAERLYGQILHSGIASGPLYYNLGNACFKQKRLGDAIFYWEKAQQKLPSDEETRQNLELANLLIVDRIETNSNPLPLRLLARIPALFTIREGIWIAFTLFLMANLLFSAYRLAKNPRHSLGALLASLGCLLLFFVSACALSWKIYDQDYVQKAVVTDQKVDVRSGPGTENITVFTIHEGLKVRVHDLNNGWRQISLPNGWSGWLTQNSIRIL